VEVFVSEKDQDRIRRRD
jgi:hypothetical protein